MLYKKKKLKNVYKTFFSILRGWLGCGLYSLHFAWVYCWKKGETVQGYTIKNIHCISSVTNLDYGDMSPYVGGS